jgi:superfamily II DNA or RNA helicase
MTPIEEKYSLVFSVFHHEYLGYLLSAHLVLQTPKGTLSLAHKKVHSNNLHQYPVDFDESDLECVRLIDEIDQQKLIVHLTKKNQRPADFFTNPKQFTPEIRSAFRQSIERRLVKVFTLLRGKKIYLMAKDGYPAGKPVEVCTDQASALFHFKRNEEGTRYYATIRHRDALLKFTKKEAFVLVNHPCWFLVEDRLVSFYDGIEGSKLKPFIDKYYIAVPPNTEKQFFENFGQHLVEKFRIRTEGSIHFEQDKPDGWAILKLAENLAGKKCFHWEWRYGTTLFDDQDQRPSEVHIDWKNNEIFIHKIKRNLRKEKEIRHWITQLGLINWSGSLYGTNEDIGGWISEHYESLTQMGVRVEMEVGGKTYFPGKPALQMSVQAESDWLDLKAELKIGPFTIPFLSLKPYIMRGEREFKLPNGQYALIPDTWFARLADIFQMGHETPNGLQFKKFHYAALQGWEDPDPEFKISGTDLIDPKPLVSVESPSLLQAQLRDYQKGGLDWMTFLRSNGFGGILADDMGLGKTIQTIALITLLQERGELGSVLLVVPSSLIFNWANELQKFAPHLRVYIHTGIHRTKEPATFQFHQVSITTYGIMRNDIEFLEKISWDILVLDEAQSIKNPESVSTKAALKLQAKLRLALTGTPVENSVIDLWSIMNFVNPGLLGGQHFFEKKYQKLIDRQEAPELAENLRRMLHAFLLRRTKEQVAKELPEKVESTIFCPMTEEQEKAYEKVKNGFRNEYLDQLSIEGLAKSRFLLLRGLTMLRQLANHPAMLQSDYVHSSGKFEEVIHRIAEVTASGSKVLVFSQFVKHLSLIRKEFDRRKWTYCYLDGSTSISDRKKEVERFSEPHAKESVFLLSLKAGGLGLNLTAADYVMILDPWWNPAIERQAVDRSHRIGQTKTVFSYKYITKGSIEEKIMKLQQAKQQVSDQLIQEEAGLVKSLTLEEIRDLLS